MTLPLVARKSVLMIASLAVPAMLLAQDYPPDLSRGKAVYERHCLSCHGTSGRGDGPAAASLRVAPANFQRFGSFLKSDEELLRTIEHGVVFSPMHSQASIDHTCRFLGVMSPFIKGKSYDKRT
jgi:hypothetical protein